MVTNYAQLVINQVPRVPVAQPNCIIIYGPYSNIVVFAQFWANTSLDACLLDGRRIKIEWR